MQIATKSPVCTPTQAPSWHAPDGQLFPQVPQFSGSLFKSAHEPKQLIKGASHTGRHSYVPAAGAHTGLSVGHTVVQSPQCSGSLYGGTHGFASAVLVSPPPSEPPRVLIAPEPAVPPVPAVLEPPRVTAELT